MKEMGWMYWNDSFPLLWYWLVIGLLRKGTVLSVVGHGLKLPRTSNTLKGSTLCVVWCDSPVVRINSGGERGWKSDIPNVWPSICEEMFRWEEREGEEEKSTCYVVLLVKVCFLWCNWGKLSGRCIRTFGLIFRLLTTTLNRMGHGHQIIDWMFVS